MEDTMVLAIQLIVASAITLAVGWVYAVVIDTVKGRLTQKDE